MAHSSWTDQASTMDAARGGRGIDASLKHPRLRRVDQRALLQLGILRNTTRPTTGVAPSLSATREPVPSALRRTFVVIWRAKHPLDEDAALVHIGTI